MSVDHKRIARVRMSGKWAEVWFGDAFVQGEEYHECCKGYMLYDAVERAELEDRLLNHGFVGLFVDWPDGADHPELIVDKMVLSKDDAVCDTDEQGKQDVDLCEGWTYWGNEV